MAIEKEIVIDIDVKGEGQLNGLSEELKVVDDSVGKTKASLDELPGSTGAAVRGVKSLSVAFKALLANPIGIAITVIVGALTGLYKVFERTAGGGDMLAKVFEGISAAIGPILDSLGRFADGLVSLLSGNFQEGLDKMRGSFDGIGNSIKEAWQNAQRLVDLRRELRDSSRELIVSESELRKQMEEQRAVLDDIDKPLSKRIAANEKLNELNLELLASRQKLIDKQLEEAKLLEEQAGLDDEAKQDALDRIAELTAANTDAQAEKARVDKEYIVKRNELFNQQKALEEEERIRQIEANKTSLEVNSERLNNIQIQGNEELNIIRNIEEQKTQIEGDSLLERQQQYERMEQLKLQATVAGLNTIASLSRTFAGESEKQQKRAFNIQKAASIASASIQTYQSANAAYLSQFLPVPDVSSPIRGGIAAGIAVAAGLANVASIASQKFNSTGSIGGGRGGFSSGGLGGGLNPVQPNFNVVGQGGINQIADLLNGQSPIKAYVVAKDVTTQQSLDRAIEQTAVL